MFELLEGKNIILRKALPGDYKSMLENVWGNEEVYKWMLYTPTLTLEEAIARNNRSIEFQKDYYAYYVALKDTNEAIGLAAIGDKGDGHYEEHGICIGSKFQGKGYGKEVVSLLLDLAFNKLNAVDFEYGYYVDNVKSKMLAACFNFQYVRTIQMVRPWDQSLKTIDVCLLTREDYYK